VRESALCFAGDDAGDAVGFGIRQVSDVRHPRHPPVFPAGWPGTRAPLVEAGGQCLRRFRGGLDYAFIRTVAGVDAERIIPPQCGGILVPSQDPSGPRKVYESLQGGPEVGPLPTPRRCHGTLPSRKSAGRFRRCELRLQPTLTDRRDP
jgi:hypothetical protein